MMRFLCELCPFVGMIGMVLVKLTRMVEFVQMIALWGRMSLRNGFPGVWKGLQDGVLGLSVSQRWIL